MTTLTYGTSNVSSKDVLAISSLLSLFERRLSAKWVMRNHPPGQNLDVMVVDVDRPGGADSMREPGTANIRVAVSDNDRAPEQWLVTRPIRAYGANGVVVLFNSLADALQNGHQETSEPPQPRVVPAVWESRPAPAPPATVVAPPPPPEPPPFVVAPPPKFVEPVRAPQPARAPDPPQPVQAKWGPPEPERVPDLIDMRTGDPQVDATPVLRVATPPPVPAIPAPEVQLKPLPQFVPAARSPHRWREPEPEVFPELIDMRTGRPVVWPNAPAPAPVPVAAAPAIAIPEPEETPAIAVPAKVETAPVPEVPSVPAETAPITTAAEPTPVPLAIVETAHAIDSPVMEEPAAIEDSGADWWSTPAPEAGAAQAPELPEVPQGETDLGQLLRDIKRAEKIGILEIAGLPAVCVVPSRRVYYTSAPVARLEAAITTRARATFRACSSEQEARSLSGTEDSRHASLNQLYWCASLSGASAPLPSALNEGPLRLKGWPPVNSASGGGRYLRFATLLSGGAVSAQQLAGLTGSDPREVTTFLQACNELGLLETADPQRRPVQAAPRPNGKAGILRSMLAQLTPPKI